MAPSFQRWIQRATGYIGYYKNSIASGNFWIGILGGEPCGHIHGKITSKDGMVTGKNISYIYPDMETALVGKFENRLMKDAQEAKVLGVKCDENGILYVNQYSTLDPSSPHYYYEPASNISFGAGPPGVLDPYERKWLEVKPASNPEMGQGVFTKRDLKKGMLFTAYVGFVYGRSNGQHEIYRRYCIMNTTKTDDERRHCKKYSLNFSLRDAEIEIPPDHDQPGSFLPSMGPKVCTLSLLQS